MRARRRRTLRRGLGLAVRERGARSDRTAGRGLGRRVRAGRLRAAAGRARPAGAPPRGRSLAGRDLRRGRSRARSASRPAARRVAPLRSHLHDLRGSRYVLALAYAAAVLRGAARLPMPGGLVRGAGAGGGGLGTRLRAALVPGPAHAAEPVGRGTRAVGAPTRAPGGDERRRELARFIASIPPEARQLLSDTLADVRRAAASGSRLLRAR